MSDKRRPRRGWQRPVWLTDQGVRWLLRSIPVLVLLVVFAIKSLSMVGVNGAGMRAYEDGSYGASRASFVQLGFLNIFERWIAPYNRGTAEYQLRDYDAARASFTVALDRAPAAYDCRVRLNLVASIEGQADVLAGQQQHTQAAERYEEGLKVLGEGNCGELPDGQSPTPSPSDSGSPSPSDSGSPTPSDSGSPTPSDSGSPTPSDSGSPSPTDDPSGEPTDSPSGEPSPGESGEPTSGPSGEPTEGSEEGQSEEERRRAEAEREREQQQRMEQKAEEQRTQAERKGEDDEGEDQDPEPPPEEPDDPANEQQRQKQLEEQSKTAQEEQQTRRDRDGRPDQRSDTPW